MHQSELRNIRQCHVYIVLAQLYVELGGGFNVHFFKSFLALSGFILNLENLENRLFLQKSGKAWNSQGILHNFFSSQDEQIISSIIFINFLHKWLFYLLSVNVNFITLHSAITSFSPLPID